MFKHLELKIKYLNNIYTNNSLKIIEKENINSSILFRSSRVGLVKSDEYSPCPYRYIKNNSEYRKHSNFKEKTLVFYYSLVLGIDSNEIKNFTDLKNLDFDKFLKNLNNWLYDEMPESTTIRTYIKNLRKKLNDETITTLKGIGYRFNIR